MAFIDVETVASNMLANSYYETLATTELPKNELNGKPVVTEVLDAFVVTAAQIDVEELLALLDSKLVNRKEVAARFLALSLAVNEDTTDVEIYEALNKYDRNREIVSVAAQMGKSYVLETIELVEQLGDNAFCTAVKEDNVDAMSLLKKVIPVDTDFSLSEAAMTGSTAAMELLLQWGEGSSDYEMALEYSAQGGYTDALKLLKEWEDSLFNVPPQEKRAEYNLLLKRAAGGSHLDAMELIRGWGVTDYNSAFQRAALNGQVASLKRLKEWSDDDPVINYEYNNALTFAAYGSHLEAMELIRRWGATDYAGALERLTFRWTGGLRESTNLLREWIAQSL